MTDLGNVTTDMRLSIFNWLPQYRVCREVCMKWRRELDTSNYIEARRNVRGRIFAYELPIHMVKTYLCASDIRRDLIALSQSGRIIFITGLRNFMTYIRWDILSVNQAITIDVADEFESNIDWLNIHKAPSINSDVLTKYLYRLDHESIVKTCKIPPQFHVLFIERHSGKLIKRQVLTEAFILEHAEKLLSTDKLAYYQILSEEFMQQYADRLNWVTLSSRQVFSEGFIRVNKDRIDWEIISHSQNLSCEFIREFADRVDWKFISKHQNLDNEFMIDFADKLNWNVLSRIWRFTEDFIRQMADNVNWSKISMYQNMSIDFIREFASRIDWNNLRKNSHIQLSREMKIEFVDYLLP